MTSYINCHIYKGTDRSFWPDPSLRMHFVDPRHISPEKKDAWFATTGMFLDVFADYFAHYPFDVAVSVVASPKDKYFSLTIGYIDEKSENDFVLQYPKPSAAYVEFLFNMGNESARLAGASVTAHGVHKAGFLRHVLNSVQSFCAETSATSVMDIGSTGAGVYTWASYGAVPERYESFIPELAAQWDKFCRFSCDPQDISPELGAWVACLQQNPTDENFRSIFTQAAANSRIKGDLKSLMLGDGFFRADPYHRYGNFGESPCMYSTPLNGAYRFLPQDPGFQNFFAGRIKTMNAFPK